MVFDLFLKVAHCLFDTKIKYRVTSHRIPLGSWRAAFLSRLGDRLSGIYSEAESS